MSKKNTVTPFPVRLTPLQEMQQQLTEINPDWCVVIMATKNGYSFMLPPEVELTEINFAIDVTKQSVIEMYQEGDFE